MNRAKFLQVKAPVVMIGNTPVAATAKEFSTGSVGFNITGKVPMVVDGEVVMLQVSGNLTAIGSKLWLAGESNSEQEIVPESEEKPKKRKRDEVAA